MPMPTFGALPLAIVLCVTADPALAPRSFHGGSRVSIRPPRGFVVSLPAASKKSERGVAPVMILDERDPVGGGTPSHLAVFYFTGRYKDLDAFVEFVAGENAQNFAGAKVETADDFPVGSLPGKRLTYAAVADAPERVVQSYAFGDAGGWFNVDVVRHASRDEAHRDLLAASVASVRRHSRVDGERELGERVLVPELGLTVRAPRGWHALRPEGNVAAAFAPDGEDRPALTIARETGATSLSDLARCLRTEGGPAPTRDEKLDLPGGEARQLDFPAADGSTRIATAVLAPGLALRVETTAPAASLEERRDAILPLLVDLDPRDPATLASAAQSASARYAQATKQGVASTAAQSLAELAANGTKAVALPVLVAGLADKAEPVRAAAAEGLGTFHLRDPKSVPPLVRLADGGSRANGPIAVAAACRTLGAIGGADAAKALLRRLSDPDEGVVRAAVETIPSVPEARAEAPGAMAKLWAKLETGAKISGNEPGKKRLAALGPPLADALFRLTGTHFSAASEATAAAGKR